MFKFIIPLVVAGVLFQISLADVSSVVESNESQAAETEVSSEDSSSSQIVECTNSTTLIENCPDNEQYSDCPSSSCQPQTCQDAGFPIPCPVLDSEQACTGPPGCVCNSDLLRDENGICIPKAECSSCGGDENAIPGCGNHCRKSCATYKKPVFCTLYCLQNGCDCRDGFVYDDNLKKCVAPEKCKNCPDNEQYSDCPSSSCQPQTCQDAGFPIPCPVLDSEQACTGPPGCVCNSDLLRDENGICIPKAECSSCGGDENAIPGCGNHCRKSCATYKKPVFCTLYCLQNGCDCRDGFVYDDNLKKCVAPEKCTPTCQVNEEFSDCSNGLCRVQDCADKGKKRPCPPMAPGSCTTGCVCKENFLRAKNGTCVPQDQCEPTCPDGEIYSDCPPVKCDAEYCPKSRNDPQTCISPKNCSPPRCICGFNRHRDRKTGKCIATSQCPPFPCNGPNESYQSCPAVCPGETCTDYLNNATCPKYKILVVVACKPACRCNEGFYRNSKNICVSKAECKGSGTPVTTPSQPNQPDQGTCTNVDAQQTALENGNTMFTGKFFYQVVKNNPEESVIMSAFSVLTPLALLALYSKGQTNQELMSALNVNTPDDIRCAFPGLLDSIKASNGTELDAGAKLYVHKQGRLSKSLQDDSEKVFHAQTESLDFTNAANASKVINQWVSDVTKGKITQLTSPDMFDSMTRLVIANAIYFKVLELKYKDEDITFLVILPRDVNGLLPVVEKLQDPKLLNKIYSSLSKQTVTIFLPKIQEVSTKTNLIDVLQSIGVKTVFDPSKSQLSGITDPDEPLFVSTAVQKATITVDEQGSEAAAANAVVVSTRALPLPPPVEFKFIADHPFIFLIKEKKMVLFTGTFAR